MTSSELEVLGLLVMGWVVLPTLIGLWARAWHRRPLVWAGIAVLATPFLFLFVVLALALSGRTKAAPD
jgi:hypothetical protein